MCKYGRIVILNAVDIILITIVCFLPDAARDRLRIHHNHGPVLISGKKHAAISLSLDPQSRDELGIRVPRGDWLQRVVVVPISHKELWLGTRLTGVSPG